MASVRKESPWASLQPKAETKAASFVSETSFDGTGVVVAILDTGVDPGAAGLSVCPDGSPKIVDILDCTGSGDVDTSKIVQASDTFTITGLTGRTLSLNPAWSNQSGEWRIGVKRAFELYPRGLAGRVKEKRKTAFDKEVHRHETALKRTIAEAKTAAKSKDGECAGRTGDVDPVKDLEARFEYLSSSVENDDPGPLYDCIVWFDGENWCAAIDTTETGDLREVEAMKSYRVARQYSSKADDYAPKIGIEPLTPASTHRTKTTLDQTPAIFWNANFVAVARAPVYISACAQNSATSTI
jgi:tripeptidyl-peptidase-2